MTGELEEYTCWENLVAMLKCFHRLGYKNIIATDMDDLRTADIPIVFKGSNYITIKLVSSDLEQIREQMKNRDELICAIFWKPQVLNPRSNGGDVSMEPWGTSQETGTAGSRCLSLSLTCPLTLSPHFSRRWPMFATISTLWMCETEAP